MWYSTAVRSAGLMISERGLITKFPSFACFEPARLKLRTHTPTYSVQMGPWTLNSQALDCFTTVVQSAAAECRVSKVWHGVKVPRLVFSVTKTIAENACSYASHGNHTFVS